MAFRKTNQSSYNLTDYFGHFFPRNDASLIFTLMQKLTSLRRASDEAICLL